MEGTERTIQLEELRGAGAEDLWLHFRPWVTPLAVAAVTVTIVLMLIVATSKSAWFLLGAGRGLVPEGYYHVWGFILTFGTVFGQAVGWLAGSAIAYYVLTLARFPSNWNTARWAMTIVYVGLAVLPFSAYHILFGGWLLSMPRVGLEEWLAANYPDAYWFVIYAHPVADFSLIPLALVFLAILWRYGESVQRSPLTQTIFALTVLATSLAVALSLALHSILVHIRITP